MEMSSKLKVNNSKDIRHQVHIIEIPLSALKKRRGQYFLKVKKKYTYQKVVVKISLDKSIILNRQNVNGNNYNIRFDDKQINISLEEIGADKKFIKKMGRYVINYMPNDAEDLSIKVKSHFKQAFYNNVILMRINEKRSLEERIETLKQNQETNPSDNLRKRDFYYADKFPYNDSPNSDGNRSRREVFGGTFSGISRSGGKRKRK